MTTDKLPKELRSELAMLNRYANVTYKIKHTPEEILPYGEIEPENFELIKQFHQIGKSAKATRMYNTTLFSTAHKNIMIDFIKGLIADKDFS